MSDPTLSDEATQIPTPPPAAKPFLPPVSGDGKASSNLGYPMQPSWDKAPMAGEMKVEVAKPVQVVEEEPDAEEVSFEVEALPEAHRLIRPPGAGVFAGKKLPRWLLTWKKIGGGSLAFSLLIHGGLLFTAGVIVVVTQSMETKVDFLPGGGTQQGAQASDALQHQVQQKKRSAVKPLPMQKLVSTSINADIVLPDAPLGLIDLPDATSMLGASKLSSSGLGKAGVGSGFNSAFGAGAVQGFVGMTFFGKLGGDGMPGTFYDLKQTQDRKPTAYKDSEAAYAAIINNAANKKFDQEAMKDDFYKASQQMSFTFLAIPNMSADEGPKAFAVEKEVEPRAWFVHYTSSIEAPEPGEYRFVGIFDDALIVYINNKPVLDGSWYAIHDHENQRRDTEIRQNFGGPAATATRQAYAGRWFKFNGPTKIDIVVGERPGGRVGGVLLIQNKKEKYEKRPDGTPILPVFAMTKPDMEGMKRLSEFKNGDKPFEIATSDIPVFRMKKPLFD